MSGFRLARAPSLICLGRGRSAHACAGGLGSWRVPVYGMQGRVNAQPVDAPSYAAHCCGAHSTRGDETSPSRTASQDGGIDGVGERKADGAGHHRTGNGRDVPGQEDNTREPPIT
jgi:hypothetical protein